MNALADTPVIALEDEQAEIRSDARHRLLEAALTAFGEEGYGVSIDRIASRAHVARQTVYNHFGSKEGLFAEVIRQASRSILVTLDGSADVRSTLIAFGQAYRERVLSAQGIAIFRMLTAEAPHFPELAHQFFKIGPAATRTRLADYLESAMQAHRVRSDDPRLAAELLVGMLLDSDRLRSLLTMRYETVDVKKTERIVDGFLRMYAVE
ncbi:MAG: TetR/AcrR family transcriptional regulator [Burkholderiaceae bacterium]|nr:TetR/AcrR family transcriptional regulator [Burkholderiaceae bacterium]